MVSEASQTDAIDISPKAVEVPFTVTWHHNVTRQLALYAANAP